MHILRTFGQIRNWFPVSSSEVYFLTFLTHEALNLIGSLNYFDSVVHKILQNRYLKTNFENAEIRGFIPTF